jgi:hypothetical protein
MYPRSKKVWHKSCRLCNSKVYIGRCTIQYDCVLWQIYETCNSLDNNCCWNCNWTENVGHKLYTDNLSAQLLDDLHAETVNCCGTVRANTGVVLRVFGRNETSMVTYRLV